MFGLGPATKIYLGVEPVDMRKGFDGLYGLVRDRLGQDPLSGHLFLFTNRQRTRVKALVWDGTGLWVCAKRLEQGRFGWPAEAAGAQPGFRCAQSCRPSCDETCQRTGAGALQLARTLPAQMHQRRVQRCLSFGLPFDAQLAWVRSSLRIRQHPLS